MLRDLMRRKDVLNAGNTNKNRKVQKTDEKREVEGKWNRGKSLKMKIENKSISQFRLNGSVSCDIPPVAMIPNQRPEGDKIFFQGFHF
jgi:hypothetical protein